MTTAKHTHNRPQRAFIVHGFEGNPHGNWFDWLAGKITAHGAAVAQLRLPNPQQPQENEWQHTLDAAIGAADEDTFLIGHSLGTISLLHFLSRHAPRRLGGLILAAGFDACLPSLPVLDDYIRRSAPDYAVLRQIAMPVHCLISDNDDHVPTALSVRMANELHSPITWIAQGGHLMASNGFTTLPPLWTALQPMLDQRGLPEK